VTTRPARRAQRGQALVEMGIVVVLLVTLLMGTIEFGRAWMIANMITHAARTGARTAAVAPPSSRNSSGVITNTSAIQTQVLTQIQNVVGTTGFTVDVTQPTIDGVPMVQVTVNAAVPYLFNLVGPSFSVARTATFRDEGR
jgi:Flp pilus assembly protein TadG